MKNLQRYVNHKNHEEIIIIVKLSITEMTGTLSVTQIENGLTNYLFKVNDNNHNKNVLVRIYGEDNILIDRNRELNILESLQKQNYGIKIYNTFINGRIEEWIDGITCDIEMLYDDKIIELIAKKLVKFHNINININYEKKSDLFDKLQLWLANVATVVTDNNEIDISKLRLELEWLEKYIKSKNSPIVFAHNDLHSLNIMVNKKNDNVVDMKLIDMEYSYYNYRAYDIANFFCTYARSDYYQTINNHPCKDIKMKFIKSYLDIDDEFDDRVISLYEEVDAFKLLPHLFWCIWGLVKCNHDNEFDHLKYVKIRLECYYKIKEKLTK